MAQVTVQQLAETVGAPVERLLSQMKDAGLPHKEAEESVSDEDKKTLLAFLKSSHGEATSAPKRITLKRKTVGTLKSGQGRSGRAVTVEVRKKRTYVKRDVPPAETPEEAPEELVEELPVAEEEQQAEAAESAPASEEPAEPVMAPEAAAEEELSPEDEKDLDPEVLRQRAAARRKREEEAEAAARAEAIAARKAEAERKAARAAAAPSPSDAPRKPKRLHDAPPATRDEPKRKKSRGRMNDEPLGRGPSSWRTSQDQGDARGARQARFRTADGEESVRGRTR